MKQDSENKEKFTNYKPWRARRRFTIGFIGIVFPFFLLSVSILHLLALHGISLNHVPNPALAMLLIGILCTILGYTASYYMMTTIIAPLERLDKASQSVARGNYNVHLDYDGEIVEIRHTFQNFNTMIQELNSVEIMRNDFIANVSHEFKTPLSSITGYVTLLQDTELTEEERNEYIQMAFFNIEKLNDLTENILRLSKLENQNTLNPPVTYRLDEQIREAIVLLEPKWSAKNINLELDLNQVMYAGQQPLLFQVWTNLISNAIKFSEENGSIFISLKDAGEYMEVLVSDNGIGMSQETLSHIFEKFYQGDSSRKEQGNGLGLALCKKILDICNGKIYVSSTPGKGSVFMVQLDSCITDSASSSSF